MPCHVWVHLNQGCLGPSHNVLVSCHLSRSHHARTHCQIDKVANPVDSNEVRKHWNTGARGQKAWGCTPIHPYCPCPADRIYFQLLALHSTSEPHVFHSSSLSCCALAHKLSPSKRVTPPLQSPLLVVACCRQPALQQLLVVACCRQPALQQAHVSATSVCVKRCLLAQRRSCRFRHVSLICYVHLACIADHFGCTAGSSGTSIPQHQLIFGGHIAARYLAGTAACACCAACAGGHTLSACCRSTGRSFAGSPAIQAFVCAIQAGDPQLRPG
jgi:hypothetical protein